MSTRSSLWWCFGLWLGVLAVAHAEPSSSPWSMRLGYGQAAFATATRLQLAGAKVPGADVDIADADLLLGDIGRQLSPHWSVRFAFGLPVTVSVAAGGSLDAYSPPLSGTLGQIEIAPLLGTLLYRPFAERRWRPYVGAGLGYVAVIEAEGRDVDALEASNAWGPVLEAGCDVTLTPRWSAYVDARKLFVGTKVTGTVPALGGPAVGADVTLDPLVLNLGVGYRF